MSSSPNFGKRISEFSSSTKEETPLLCMLKLPSSSWTNIVFEAKFITLSGVGFTITVFSLGAVTISRIFIRFSVSLMQMIWLSLFCSLYKNRCIKERLVVWTSWKSMMMSVFFSESIESNNLSAEYRNAKCGPIMTLMGILFLDDEHMHYHLWHIRLREGYKSSVLKHIDTYRYILNRT